MTQTVRNPKPVSRRAHDSLSKIERSIDAVMSSERPRIELHRARRQIEIETARLECAREAVPGLLDRAKQEVALLYHDHGQTEAAHEMLAMIELPPTKLEGWRYLYSRNDASAFPNMIRAALDGDSTTSRDALLAKVTEAALDAGRMDHAKAAESVRDELMLGRLES